MTNFTVLSYTADPSIATVLILLILGLLGTFFNLALLLAALADMKQCGVLGLPAPLSCTLVHLAATGIIESTLNVSLSAFYASGGLITAKDSSVAGKAVLLGALLFTGVSHAWGIAGVMLSSLQNFTIVQKLPGSGVDRVRVAFVFIFGISIAFTIAIIVVLIRNKNAISSTSVIPRIKVINISQGFRYVIAVVGYGVPWLSTVLGFGLHGFTSIEHAGIFSRSASSVLTPSRYILVAGVLSLYILLRVPFDLASMIAGARPMSLHAALAWCRFAYCPLSPLAALLSLGRLKSTLRVLLRCFPRSRAISPPAALRPQAPVEIRVNSVQLLTPVIFPTPGGLYLRLSRHHLTSGFSYRACDVTSDVPYSKAQLERRDVFLREPRKSVY